MIGMAKGIHRAGLWLVVAAACAGLGTVLFTPSARAQALSPAALRVDEMVTPLGIDDAQPRFSWQLRDNRQGARQTAYRLLVASKPELLAVGKVNVWDSGRIASGQSVAVPYAGASIAPSTRYFWKVLLWDQENKLAPESPVSWWESGLLNQAWRAQWIGYETAEERAVRHSGAKWITSPKPDVNQPQNAEEHITYRAHVELTKPVRRATLYVSAEDTASAWINGQQVMKSKPLPAWKQLPWKKYVPQEVTAALSIGANASLPTRFPFRKT